jgi:hypothetical protein
VARITLASSGKPGVDGVDKRMMERISSMNWRLFAKSGGFVPSATGASRLHRKQTENSGLSVSSLRE